MPTSPIDALLAAIQQRWTGGDRSVDADYPLVKLGKADVERPVPLKRVISLRRGGSEHAVLALVALDDVKLDGESFAHIRDEVRAIAHYLATHLNPLSLADNAHVWAVAPSGKEGDNAWLRLRQEVHQDTWSVPKTVWLPGTPPDATAFLEQGFLAMPWAGKHTEGTEGLELIERFAKKLGRGTPWEPERVQKVLDTLRNSQTAPEANAMSLISLAEELQ